MFSKRRLAVNLLRLTHVDWLIRRMKPWDGLLVLAYHRIGTWDVGPFDSGVWSATPDAFDAQVRALKQHCDVIAAKDLPDIVGRQRGRFALITFDDGYRDNYEVAFPILKSNGVSAVFFVTTGLVDGKHASWWDEIAWMARTSKVKSVRRGRWLESDVILDEPTREQAIGVFLSRYKRLAGADCDAYLEYLAEALGTGRCNVDMSGMWMTWSMLREMHAAGMCIGGHTVSHPILARLETEQQEAEISRCIDTIQSQIGVRPKLFSYPVGRSAAFSDVTRAYLRESGVEFAFSYYGGYNPCEQFDVLDIRRTAIECDTTIADLCGRLTVPALFS